MKNCFKYMLTGAVAMLMSVSVYAGEAVNTDALIYVNGKLVNEASAKLVDGYTVVPIRFIADRLSCDISWDDTNKTVTVVEGNTVLTLKVGSKDMYVSGEKKEIPVAPIMSEDHIYVPLRAISDGLDIDIAWNEMTRTISVYSASAAKAQFNNDYSEAPEAVLDTVYLCSNENIVIPVNADPNKKIDMTVSNEDVCTAKLGYMDGKSAIFIKAEGKGTSGITLSYPGYSSTGYYKTYVNVRIVDRKEKALINFDDMLIDKDLHYKDIFTEIEEQQSKIEKENGIFIFDKNDSEYEKLYVGDTGMLIIPVDYNADASGEFNISYDFDSAIECRWGMYDGKYALMITSNDYSYAPVRITFKENNSGYVSFTTTDKDMSIEETPAVLSYGKNSVDSTNWDFYIRAIADNAMDLKIKLSLVKDRIVYID
ncbi:MAG: copper amine oxidase N-terminal domain-containing protein [Candidatus Metalachnospira sp.]|nr:copper amine oxidase N-terminal domain-containing protein [Candidatus Metalachnospira sp.]